jgi:glycosyltransferase involved in cell wall biosynthesis
VSDARGANHGPSAWPAERSAAVSGTALHFLLPEGFDDPARPSGGNVYDRRLAAGLAALGWKVVAHPVAGAWPWPDAAARRCLAETVTGLADASTVLVDGLIGSSAPDVLVPAAARVRLAVLVHLPLGDAPAGHETKHAAAREAEALGAAAAIVTTSDWTRTRLLETYRLAPDRVHVALPGTDPAAVADGSPAGERLLCVAAVAAHKGHDTLIDALARIADLPWRCTCVGPLEREPEFVDQLRDRLARSRLDDRVVFTGPRAEGALADSYAHADLVVHASRVEAYGMVLAEALARGVPVVSTAVGGVAEAIGRTRDGRRPGLLVPPGDSAALATALARWLRDATLRRELRDAARYRRPTLPRWATTAGRVAAVLHGLVANAG